MTRAVSPPPLPAARAATARARAHASCTGMAVAERCIASGEGLQAATVGQTASFQIQAIDATGQRRESGGDLFSVTCRGPARAHAKVTDNRDGTYTCSWRSSTSGAYYLTISLSGIQIHGSPFTPYVYPTQPHAPNCEARGNALFSAKARAIQAFEVQFRDMQGQASLATELDVFVETIAVHERPSPPKQDGRSATRRLHQPPPLSPALNSQRPLASSPSLDANFLSAHPMRGSIEGYMHSSRASPGASSRSPKPKLLLVPIRYPVQSNSERTRGIQSHREAPEKRVADGLQSPPASAGRTRLHVEERRHHAELWERRAKTDRSVITDTQGKGILRGSLREKSAYSYELDSNPVGFAVCQQ